MEHSKFKQLQSIGIIGEVHDFILENFQVDMDDNELEHLSKHQVLDYYLKWNGIFGWTYEIEQIMED